MTEQQPYQVVREYDQFEVRRYPEHLFAEIESGGALKAPAIAGSATYSRISAERTKPPKKSR